MRRIDLRHLAPRRQFLWRDVGPVRAAVSRRVHEPIVGSDPDQIHVLRRRSDRVDDAAVRALRCVGSVNAERTRDARIGARQIAADDRPAAPAIDRLVEPLRREEQHMRIDRGEDDRRRAIESIVFVANDDGANVLDIAGALVVPRHLPAENDAGMQRVGRRVAVLLDADRVPFTKRDFAVVAAARDAGRSAFLLAAVQPVGKAVIGGHVEHLRCRLVVPEAPCLSAVDCDGRALIGRDQHDGRVHWVDPDRVVVVSARSAFEAAERAAAVDRFVGRRVRRVHDVRIARVDADVREVVAAPPHARLVVHARPALAGVVGPIDAGGLTRCGHPGVDAARVARCDADADAAETLRHGRQTASERLPRVAAVDRLEQAARRAGVRVVVFPRRLPRRPERRIDDLRVRRIEGDVDGAGVFVLVEHPLPRSSAIDRTEDAALAVGTVRMAERRDEHAIGIARIDDQRADLTRLSKAEMRPRSARIG